MERENPKVSIIMPCYNHGNFVGDAIESVLNQTYQNYEFLIADNGSTDNSAEVIRSYGDKITYLYLEKNNPLKCTDMLWKAARGQYVAMLCSDDYWYPQKLEKQIEAVKKQKGCEIFFTWAEMVDGTLKEVINDTTFKKTNRTKEQWIKTMMFENTCLELSSLLIKNDGRYQRYYKNVSKFKQLPDLALYLNMTMKEEIYVVEEYLVKHRMHGANVSYSSHSSGEINSRSFSEIVYLRDWIFRNLSDEQFQKVFGEFLPNNTGEETKADIMCQRILLYLNLTRMDRLMRTRALDYCWEHYNDDGVAELLEEKYQFGLEDIYKYETEGGIGELRKKEISKDLYETLQKGSECLLKQNIIFANAIEAGENDIIEIAAKTQQMAIKVGRIIENYLGEGHVLVKQIEQYCETVYQLSQKSLGKKESPIIQQLLDKSILYIKIKLDEMNVL